MLVEGAGSASEVNLRRYDIANMGFARAADVPVVLIGDIDRGGVIASLVGTKAVLDPEDAALVAGFIINKFRGDPSLFIARHGRDRGGHRLAGARARPVLCRRAHPARRGRARARSRSGSGSRDATLKIAVPILPQIANFDDLDPLEAEPSVDLVRVRPGTRAARRCRSRHPAGLEGDDRRSRRVARKRLRHRHRRACAARRRGARPVRRLSDARADRCAIPTASRARPARSKAWDCSTSKRCCRRRRGWSPRPARRPTGVRSPATRCTWA